MIKRMLLIAGVAAMLAAPSGVQAQTAPSQAQMTIPEFRQVLVDLGTYLDNHKGSNLASQFAAISDDTLSKIYPSVSNPRQLQSAVAALKQHDAASATGTLPASRASLAPRPLFTANAVAGNCPPDTIIDNSPGAACTPAYPDPTNTAWNNMVNPLITFGAFSPTDYPSVSSQTCGLTVESNLVQVTAALNGTVTVAAIACGAFNIDPIGGSVAAGVCDAAVAVVGVAGAVSQGLLADCFEQDADVNAAENSAAFHNTVTIYDALNAGFTATNTHLTNVNNQINTNLSNDFSALSTQVANVDIHLTSVDNHIATEFATLTGVVNQATALFNAEFKQVMKLEMTPDGQKILNPAILTCTGTNCPNVLAACPAAGCSWNRVGPLP